MNFLEARRIVSDFRGGPELPFLFAMSGLADPFRLYLEAAAATRGRQAVPAFLPFGTLGQHLAATAPASAEVFLLLPWDLVPETDWRSGVPERRVEAAEVLARAAATADRLRGRPAARLLYLSAPLPPLTGSPTGDRALARELEALALALGAVEVPVEAFALSSCFTSGCPVGGAWLGRVAGLAVEALLADPEGAAKVIVTDLDNTLWSGVVAEDGLDGIAFGPEGRGYPHYVYQSLLARLKGEGILLAAVSRNDPDTALGPLRSGRMRLGESDFVAVIASYHAKSAQIAELARALNLGLDSFLFVDDNPIELSEVGAQLPLVRCLTFPQGNDELPDLLDQVGRLCSRARLTEEDRERTELYRRRLEGLTPVGAAGADLTAFLAGLDMELTIHDRSSGDRTRAVQLINKTNQFNLNGRRWTDAEVGEVLEKGGRLLGGSLADRAGQHGEVLALLLAPDGTVEAFVMSCRVFQRRAEYAFLASLHQEGIRPTGMRFAPTDRNEPFRQFLQDDAFALPGDNGSLVSFDADVFADRHGEVRGLFRTRRG